MTIFGKRSSHDYKTWQRLSFNWEMMECWKMTVFQHSIIFSKYTLNHRTNYVNSIFYQGSNILLTISCGIIKCHLVLSQTRHKTTEILTLRILKYMHFNTKQLCRTFYITVPLSHPSSSSSSKHLQMIISNRHFKAIQIGCVYTWDWFTLLFALFGLEWTILKRVWWFYYKKQTSKYWKW